MDGTKLNPVGRAPIEYVRVSHAVSEPAGRTMLHAVHAVTSTSETLGSDGAELASVVTVKVLLTVQTVTVAAVEVL